MRRTGKRMVGLMAVAGMAAGLLASRPAWAADPAMGAMAPQTQPAGGDTAMSGGPATMPTTEPTGIAVDQTTPRGALKFFLSAEARGDGDQLKQVLRAESPEQESFLDAMAEQKSADRDLANAMMDKFPNAGFDPRARRDQQLAMVLPKIDLVKEDIVGDTATLSSSNSANPKGTTFTLKKVDDKWYIPLSALIRPESMDTGIHMFSIQTAIMKQGMNDVNSGQYATLSDAASSIAHKMHDALVAAQTQPSMMSGASTQP